VNDLLAWAPLIAACAIVWAGDHVASAIRAANLDRHNDHRELMRSVATIESDIGKLELYLSGLSDRYDPADLSDYA
jgi:hypothetical protein